MRYLITTGLKMIVIGGMIASNAVAAPAGHAPAPAAVHPAAAHPPQRHVVVNPHLHLRPEAIRGQARPAVVERGGRSRRGIVVTRHHWTRYWHYTEWIALHRGTGTITGRVVGADGAPVDGATVGLRSPSGRVFRRWSSKHIVHTTADGLFVMRHVRLGGYRVRAHLGKPFGTTTLSLHGGQVASVLIHL